MTRREWLAALPVLSVAPGRMHAAAGRMLATGTGPQDAKGRPAPYLGLQKYIEPGADEFAVEKAAMEIRRALVLAAESGELPLAAGVRGHSPAAIRHEAIEPDVQAAVYDSRDTDIAKGWKDWLASLGKIRRMAFYPLPESVVRYEVAATTGAGRLEYRVGRWRQTWVEGRLTSFEPIEEHLASAAEPWFRDVTAHAFEATESYEKQLARGIPYWRSRLDPATGIDVYGSNGIAVGDLDGDGVDELYVCQPGGLPNRLYKFGKNGELTDITERWGAGLLDDTSCALFLDLRNSGRQDLVVLRAAGPTLFVNTGERLEARPEAFRFQHAPAGGFTGMAAADFDRDGKLDLYLCCYVYFQSEAQYTYAAPYYDAQNGPPNFLFRNRLTAEDGGHFEDCTEETGISENNNRFSFAPAWCDYNEDGWPDLYVANDFGRKNLYVNRGGRFRDEAAAAGVEDVGPGMSASWFDYDGDGRADLYVANMWSDAGQRVVRDANFGPAHGARASEAYRLHTRGNSLYRNGREGRFDDVTESEHAEFGRWAWASGGHDLDNDGVPELLVTCGMLTNESPVDLMSFFWRQVVAKSPDSAVASTPYQNGWNAINQFIREDYSWSGREPNVLQARRGGRYYDVSGVSGFDFADDSRAFAVTDWDGDGRPDVVLKSRLAPQVRVLQNNCAGENQAIGFRLQGTRSNRDAVGARVRVDGRTKWLEAGSGFLSQHSKQLLFGLGKQTRVERVQVRWPSGLEQEFRNLAAGRVYTLKEGSPELHEEPFRAHRAISTRVPKAENHLGLQDTWLAEPVPLPERQDGARLLLVDAAFLEQRAERRQWYEIFRRYLFDWRGPLRLPLPLLLNGAGDVVKVYGEKPSQEQVATDLKQMDRHAELALPFAGEYVLKPRRDLFKFGVAYLWAGYPDQAVPYLEAKLSSAPGNARVSILLAQIYLSKDEFKTAERFYRQTLAADSRQPEAAYGLGVALSRQNQLAEARQCFERAIELRHGYAEAINDLGALYMQQGKTEDAIAAFQYGVSAAPDEDILYMNLARVYVKIGQLERARQVVQQLLDRKPESAAGRRAWQELSGR